MIYITGSSHGVGVYLAVKAATSVQGYCTPDPARQRHIYLTRALTGDYGVGQAAGCPVHFGTKYILWA